MNGFTLANPAGLGLLALMMPILALHILRPRRRRVAVSSTYLWRGDERPVSSASPWQRLRWSALLAAQLLAVALLALAVARPSRAVPAELAQHTVFIVDASGSMRARDGDPDRIAAAVDAIDDLRDDLPDGGIVSVVEAAERARVLVTASDDADDIDRALGALAPAEGPGDLAGAFTLAAALDTGIEPIGFVLVSDGQIPDELASAAPPGTRLVGVGELSTNRAIEQLTVEPRGDAMHVRAVVRHLGGPAVVEPLVIDVDGRQAITQDVSLADGATEVVEADVPAGEAIVARLGGDDLLAVDSTAYAVGRQRQALRVGLIGDGAFVEQALAAIGEIEIVRDPDLESPSAAGDIDVLVVDGVAVPDGIDVPILAFAPPGGIPGGVDVDGAAGGLIDAPIITSVDSTDGLLAGLDLSQIGIVAAQRVAPANPSTVALVGSEDGPLLLAGATDVQRFVYVAFTPTQSDLPLQVAFPVLVDRAVAGLAAGPQQLAAVIAGQPLPIDPAVVTTVTTPAGQQLTLQPGDPAPLAAATGFWQIRVGDQPAVTVAVNADPGESVLAPRLSVALPPAIGTDGPGADPSAADRRPAGTTLASLLWAAVAALALVMAVEWWLAARARAVPHRQWRAAQVLRGAVAALALVALLDPHLDRPADDVAVTFLVDASASLGPNGQVAAEQFVRDAVDAMPASARAAVVAFGADARLDQPTARSVVFDSVQVRVDDSATDVAAALRLGQAVLPSDARRRIVLVSDGRASGGNPATGTEVRDLAAAGIPVDAVVVEPVQGADVAVASIEVPSLARVGDAVAVTAVVRSTVDTTATVTLTRDGEEVGRRTVELSAGDTPVVFTDTAAAPDAAATAWRSPAPQPRTPSRRTTCRSRRCRSRARRRCSWWRDRRARRGHS
jgi:Ca-activated chloride channel homolog